MKALLILITISLYFNSIGQETCSIFFNTNTSTILPEAEAILTELTSKKDHIKILSITAYTDRRGSDSLNLALAMSRLNEVKKKLSMVVLIADKTEARGKSYPANTNKLDEYSYWRRVDITYSQIAPKPIEATTLENPPSVEQVISPRVSNQFDAINLDSIKSGKLEAIPLKIEFYPGMDVLKEYSKPELVYLYDFLATNKKVKVFIRGHVCCMDDYDLSVRRAEAVYTALNTMGITRSRMTYKGFSNYMPSISPEITEEDKQKNRRVDVIFTME